MFRIYKPGQGKYTRLCSGLSAGLLTVLGAEWLYRKLDGLAESGYKVYLQVGIPSLLIAGLGLLIFWIVNKPNAADFMIATEGEMKKVSWSTRQEIIGSTKVVIFTTIFLAMLLFLVDLCFMKFFQFIGVLKIFDA